MLCWKDRCVVDSVAAISIISKGIIACNKEQKIIDFEKHAENYYK